MDLLDLVVRVAVAVVQEAAHQEQVEPEGLVDSQPEVARGVAEQLTDQTLEPVAQVVLV